MQSESLGDVSMTITSSHQEKYIFSEQTDELYSSFSLQDFSSTLDEDNDEEEDNFSSKFYYRVFCGTLLVRPYSVVAVSKLTSAKGCWDNTGWP